MQEQPREQTGLEMPRNSAWQAPLCQGKQARRGRGATRFVERLSRHCCRRLRYSLSDLIGLGRFRCAAGSRIDPFGRRRHFGTSGPVSAFLPLQAVRPLGGRVVAHLVLFAFLFAELRSTSRRFGLGGGRRCGSRNAKQAEHCQRGNADTNQAPVLRHSAPPSHPTAPQQSTVRRRARRRNPRNDGSTHGFSLGEDRDE